jgi:hypothetical protein
VDDMLGRQSKSSADTNAFEHASRLPLQVSQVASGVQHLTFHSSARPQVKMRLFPYPWKSSLGFRRCRASFRREFGRSGDTCGFGEGQRTLAAGCGHLRPGADTCGRVRTLAAGCGHLRPGADAWWEGHFFGILGGVSPV